MTSRSSKPERVLALAMSSRGFGFAVMERPETLVDWGIKTTRGDKNASCLKQIASLITHYQPTRLVLEDHWERYFRRYPRLGQLNEGLKVLAQRNKLKLTVVSRKKVRNTFFATGRGSKQKLAELLAKRFPEELGPRLPKPRKPWMSESYWMGVFEAVALSWIMQM